MPSPVFMAPAHVLCRTLRRCAALRQHAVRVLLMLVLACATEARVAEACTCMVTGPACENFWRAEYVFDGTVTALESIERPVSDGESPGLPVGRLVQFRVHRGWKNVSADVAEVVTGRGGGDCGYRFEVGRRYLVFGYPDPEYGRIYSGICSATKPYESAAADVEWLEARDRGAAKGQVFGTIRYYSRGPTTEHTRDILLDGVEVVLSGPTRDRRTRTVDGRYAFEDLAPGYYRLTPEFGPHLQPLRFPVEFEIRGEGGCAQRDLYTTDNGRIAGLLLQHDGTPATPSTEVQAQSLGPPNDSIFGGYTSEDGAFEIGGLPPGRYVLGVNLRNDGYAAFPRLLHPGGAEAEPTVLEIQAGERVVAASMTLPPPAGKRTIAGVLIGPAGTPLADRKIHAMLVTPDGPTYADSTHTAAGGRFKLELRDRETYVLELREPGQGEPLILGKVTVAGSDVNALRLQVKLSARPD